MKKRNAGTQTPTADTDPPFEQEFPEWPKCPQCGSELAIIQLGPRPFHVCPNKACLYRALADDRGPLPPDKEQK